MDARRVFQFCRRLLHDRDFQHQVLGPDGDEHLATLDLTPEELAIARAFHAERASMYWPLAGFQYRAVTVARDALNGYGPMTARLLSAHSCDVRDLARRFVESDGYRDGGLNYCRTALKFLAHLKREFLAEAEIPYLADAIALDRTMTELLQRVATLPHSQWSAPADPPALSGEQQYIRSPLTSAVALEYDVTQWLQEPEQIGKGALDRTQPFLIVQFIPDEDMPDSLVVDESAFRLYTALAQPLLVRDAQALLADDELARSLMDDFLNLDVIRPLPATAAAQPRVRASNEVTGRDQ